MLISTVSLSLSLVNFAFQSGYIEPQYHATMTAARTLMRETKAMQGLNDAAVGAQHTDVQYVNRLSTTSTASAAVPVPAAASAQARSPWP